ncbi:MAG: isoprenylcysteine carboxyl methyltransferase family protein [Actinomycetes bacterium]
MPAWYLLLVLAVAAERVAELVVARRHVASLRARGAVEHGASHYPVMVVLHTALLAGCLVEAAERSDPPTGLAVGMTLLVVAAQGLRWWCITSLGDRWTTRVLVLPGAPLVEAGPYRFRWLRHPNYVAVVVEGFALPLAGAAWVTALVFTVLNALLLRHRIHVENAALAAAVATPARVVAES